MLLEVPTQQPAWISESHPREMQVEITPTGHWDELLLGLQGEQTSLRGVGWAPHSSPAVPSSSLLPPAFPNPLMKLGAVSSLIAASEWESPALQGR